MYPLLKSQIPKSRQIYPEYSLANGPTLEPFFLRRAHPGSGPHKGHSFNPREINILVPNNQRQHRALHIQKDLLPYALC